MANITFTTKNSVFELTFLLTSSGFAVSGISSSTTLIGTEATLANLGIEMLFPSSISRINGTTPTEFTSAIMGLTTVITYPYKFNNFKIISLFHAII